MQDQLTQRRAGQAHSLRDPVPEAPAFRPRAASDVPFINLCLYTAAVSRKRARIEPVQHEPGEQPASLDSRRPPKDTSIADTPNFIWPSPVLLLLLQQQALAPLSEAVCGLQSTSSLASASRLPSSHLQLMASIQNVPLACLTQLNKTSTSRTRHLRPCPALVGYQGEWLESMSCGHDLLWELSSFQPVSQPKQAVFCALCPEALQGSMLHFARELGSVYAACRLGEHLPIEDITNGMQCYELTAAGWVSSLRQACDKLQRRLRISPPDLQYCGGGLTGWQGGCVVIYVVSPTSDPQDVAVTLHEAVCSMGSCLPGGCCARSQVEADRFVPGPPQSSRLGGEFMSQGAFSHYHIHPAPAKAALKLADVPLHSLHLTIQVLTPAMLLDVSGAAARATAFAVHAKLRPANVQPLPPGWNTSSDFAAQHPARAQPTVLLAQPGRLVSRPASAELAPAEPLTQPCSFHCCYAWQPARMPSTSCHESPLGYILLCCCDAYGRQLSPQIICLYPTDKPAAQVAAERLPAAHTAVSSAPQHAAFADQHAASPGFALGPEDTCYGPSGPLTPGRTPAASEGMPGVDNNGSHRVAEEPARANDGKPSPEPLRRVPFWSTPPGEVCRTVLRQARALYASRHRQAEQLTISRLGIMPDDEAEAWSNLRVRNAALSAADHDYAECLPRINICTVAPCLARRLDSFDSPLTGALFVDDGLSSHTGSVIWMPAPQHGTCWFPGQHYCMRELHVGLVHEWEEATAANRDKPCTAQAHAGPLPVPSASDTPPPPPPLPPLLRTSTIRTTLALESAHMLPPTAFDAAMPPASPWQGAAPAPPPPPPGSPSRRDDAESLYAAPARSENTRAAAQTGRLAEVAAELYGLACLNAHTATLTCSQHALHAQERAGAHLHLPIHCAAVMQMINGVLAMEHASQLRKL